MIVSTPAIEDAIGHVAEMYQGDLDDDGFVYSHTQVMAVNPEAHQAFEALMRAIVPSIGIRTYELATLGAARGIPSPHCLLAHGRKTLRAGALDEDQLESGDPWLERIESYIKSDALLFVSQTLRLEDRELRLCLEYVLLRGASYRIACFRDPQHVLQHFLVAPDKLDQDIGMVQFVIRLLQA